MLVKSAYGAIIFIYDHVATILGGINQELTLAGW